MPRVPGFTPEFKDQAGNIRRYVWLSRSKALMNRGPQATELVALDLHGLELVAVAACESSATDRLAPEHPFNVQTAMVMAGARMACGPPPVGDRRRCCISVHSLNVRVDRGRQRPRRGVPSGLRSCGRSR